MNRKYKIFFLSILTLLSLIFCNVFPIKSATISWNVGDTFTFGIDQTSFSELINLEEDITVDQKIIQRNEIRSNITAIDTTARTYNRTVTDFSGSIDQGNIDYSWEPFANAFLGPDKFFYNIFFEWDYINNRTACISFDIYFYQWYLIEPEWSELNELFVDVFNESYVVYALPDPYEPLIHNFTIGYILDNIDYEIMGKKNLVDAKNQFQSDTSEWFFEFDLANFVFSKIFNGTHDIFIPSETYKIKRELKYDQEGILEKYHKCFEISYAVDDIKTTIATSYTIMLGGLEALSGNYAIIAAFAGLTTLSVIILVIKRKKRK
ncbi:MAG: hypothetical protein FK732_00475 [Asgard group archaeon]|nr:hypothetical protein [Asgard group archaeon]